MGLLIFLAENPTGTSNQTLVIAALLLLGAAIAIVFLAGRKKVAAPVAGLDLNPLARLKAGLAKTRGGFAARLKSVFTRSLDETTLDALGDVLLQADMGPETTERVVSDLKAAYREKKFERPEQMLEFLKQDLSQKLGGDRPKLNEAPKPPTVILVMGVNGTGKTTSVAKITRFLARDGKKVLLAASDTFRAAAVEQLSLWVHKLNSQFRQEAEAAAKAPAGGAVAAPPAPITVEIVKGDQGADPASIAHDACEKALAKGFDYVLIDTAGRLHTAKNLMTELEKISRVVSKKVPGAPHESLLVLDATTGQNAIRQAQEFTQAAKVTGIFLAKLDGTAKGGIVVAIRHHLDIPVKFVGLGEKPDDIQPFEAGQFVEALFS
ncbi:signal recognition particle-docking protein FtsY [bacterium]|nr:signal recognition particle-docking protein FtsY [bacterium]